MEERRFDELTQILGQATSRRQVLKGLVGAAFGSALAVLGARVPRGALAADTPTCNGAPYDPATQCCERTGIEQRYPIADLSHCPDRVPHPGHTPGFNGCGPAQGFSRYIIPNKVGSFREVDFTPACNNHDICYDTCLSDKATCDRQFYGDMSTACAKAYPSDSWYDRRQRSACRWDAYVYYLAVSRTSTGRNAYESAQKEACDCCPACQNCDGPSDQCCGNACVDVSSDPDNCGACGQACRADQACIAAECQCPSGQLECDGQCVNLSTNHDNCGACGQACDADQVCTGGTCQCPADQTECNGRCVDLQDDPANCGACDQSCGDQACVNGTCQCPTGQTECNGQCVDLLNDSNNCGTCGQPCDGQQCCNGVCQTDCGACSTNPCKPGPGEPENLYICCVDDFGGAYCCYYTQTCAASCSGGYCCQGPFPPGCDFLGCSG